MGKSTINGNFQQRTVSLPEGRFTEFTGGVTLVILWNKKHDFFREGARKRKGECKGECKGERKGERKVKKKVPSLPMNPYPSLPRINKRFPPTSSLKNREFGI